MKTLDVTETDEDNEYPDWVKEIMCIGKAAQIKALKELANFKMNIGVKCNVCPYKLYVIQAGGLIIPKDSLENGQGIFQQWVFEEQKRVSEFTKYDGDLESYCNKCLYKTLALKSDLSEESIIESMEVATLDFEYLEEMFCITLKSN